MWRTEQEGIISINWITKKKIGKLGWIKSSSVDMNTDGYEEDCDETKKDDGVDKDGNSTGVHISKLHNSAFSRELE